MAKVNKSNPLCPFSMVVPFSPLPKAVTELAIMVMNAKKEAKFIWV